jgi:transcriptional regulator with XRE-family HTH domain
MPKQSEGVLDRQKPTEAPEAAAAQPESRDNTSPPDGADFAVDVDRFVAGRIRHRRRELAMNQRDFAKALGVSLQQVHKYETGANRVSAGRLFVMAETLGVRVDYFYPSAALTAVAEERQRQELDVSRLAAAISDPTHCEILRGLCHVFLRAETGEKPTAVPRADASATAPAAREQAEPSAAYRP